MALDADKGLGGVIATKKENLDQLINRRNVVGVGVGYKVTATGPTDELAVVVNVQQKIPKSQLTSSDLIPSEIDQVRTDVVETGVMRALQSHQGRWRPTIPAGVSIGHLEVSSGTLGCLVRRGDRIYILSNNHVLANTNKGRRGDPIIQPGQYDGGTKADQIAVLADYVPIDFGDEPAGCQYAEVAAQILNAVARIGGSEHRVAAYKKTPGLNRVDAALARPLQVTDFQASILELGQPAGVREVGLGARVKKSGRTTGLTEGQIIQVDVTTSVVYDGRKATFTDQLMAQGMSAPGDSGSIVFDEDNYVVGLVYAGSSAATLINPIGPVLAALNVELVT